MQEQLSIKQKQGLGKDSTNKKNVSNQNVTSKNSSNLLAINLCPIPQQPFQSQHKDMSISPSASKKLKQYPSVEAYQKTTPQNSTHHLPSLISQNQTLKLPQIQQFTEAWKSQSNFSILLIQKLSIIVTNYFKMLSEVQEHDRQISVLVEYNKKLIQILNKFQDQERKLIQKLKIMEEFNCKIMKELCTVKNRAFNQPQLKVQESIFSKFSLKKLSYMPPDKKQEEFDDNYKKRIQKLFKQYLLQKAPNIIYTLKQQITKHQTQLKSQPQFPQSSSSNASLLNQKLCLYQKIQQLQQLISNIQSYNHQFQQPNKINFMNIFDLYQLQWQIKQKIQKLKPCSLEQQKEKQKEKQVNMLKQRLFVENVKKMHANLTVMNQNQLLTYLKKEKEIRKKIKKERLKEQEIFSRMCEQVQNQNNKLKIDKEKLKKRILQLEELASRLKAQLQIKNLKRINKSNMDQSMLSVGQTQKYSLKKSKIDQKQNKRLRQQIQKQIKQQINKNLLIKNKNIIQNIRKNGIKIQDNLTQQQIINFLLQYFKQVKKVKEQKNKLDKSSDKDSDIISPKMSDRSQYLSINTNFIKYQKDQQLQSRQAQIKKLKTQIQQLNKQITQIKLTYEQIQIKKSKQIQQLQSQQKNKQTNHKNLQTKIISLQNILKQSNNKQSQHKKQLNAKIQKQKALLNKIKQLQQQIKINKQKLKQVQKLNFSAEKLSQRLVNTVQVLINQNITYDKFLVLMDQMFANLKKYVDQYKRETGKEMMMTTHMLDRSNYSNYDQNESRNELKPKKYSNKNHKKLCFNCEQKQQKKYIQTSMNTQPNKQQIYRKTLPMSPKNAEKHMQKYQTKQPSQLKSQQKFNSGSQSITQSVHLRNSSKKSKNQALNSNQISSNIKNMDNQNNDKGSVTFKNSHTFIPDIIKKGQNIIKNQNMVGGSVKVANLKYQNSTYYNSSQHLSQSKMNSEPKTSKIQQLNTIIQQKQKQQKISPNGQQNQKQQHINKSKIQRLQLSGNISASVKRSIKQFEQLPIIVNVISPQKLKKNSQGQQIKPSRQYKTIQSTTNNINNNIKTKKNIDSIQSSDHNANINGVSSSIKNSLISNGTSSFNSKSLLSHSNHSNIILLNNKNQNKLKNHQNQQNKSMMKQIQKQIQHSAQTNKANLCHSRYDIDNTDKDKNIKNINNVQNVNLKPNNQLNVILQRSFVQRSLISQSKPPEMNQISLDLSEELNCKSSNNNLNIINNDNEQYLATSLAILPHKYSEVQIISKNDNQRLGVSMLALEPTKNIGSNIQNSYLNNSSNNNKKLDYSALSVGVQLKFVQKMFKKFQQDDTLDFYQLFQRYKQALQCLQRAQLLNRYNQVRYRKFINSLLSQKQIDPSYSVQQQLYKLKRYVLQQEQKMSKQKNQQDHVLFQNIKISEKNVNKQLKLLRMQYYGKSGKRIVDV